MAVLERYEWADMWWDEPGREGCRILLAGDSITRSYRNPLKELAGNDFYIDMFATSRAVDNPAYLRELRCMISDDPRYAVIHFNNGLHGFHQSVETYTKHYEDLIVFFQREFKDAALILALTTPVTQPGTPEAYGERNKTVLERNRALRQLAGKYKLPVDDLYASVDGKGAVKADDGVHFTDEGCRILAQRVFQMLRAAPSGPGRTGLSG